MFRYPLCFLPLLLSFVSVSLGLAETWDVPGQLSTIQAAIDTSANGDSVLVSSGTYIENLSIVGKNVTLISVSGAQTTALESPAVPIIYIEDVDSSTVIQGFTVQNAYSETERGGAVQIRAGFLPDTCPTINDCRFISNQARFGGAIDTSEGAYINGCEFVSNQAWQGGAISLWFGGWVNVTDSRFEGNVASNAGSPVPSGGAIACLGFSNGTRTVIRDNVFNANQALNGGAIRTDENGLICGNTFYRNEALGGGVEASGIWVLHEDAKIEFNVISEGKGVGILASQSASPVLTCNIVFNNLNGNYSGLSPGPTDLQQNPQFCAPFIGNFDLQATSPCLPSNNPFCDQLIGASSQICPMVDVKDPGPGADRSLVVYQKGTQIIFEGLDLTYVSRVRIFGVRGNLVATDEFASRSGRAVLQSKSLSAPLVSGLYFFEVADVRSQAQTQVGKFVYVAQ